MTNRLMILLVFLLSIGIELGHTGEKNAALEDKQLLWLHDVCANDVKFMILDNFYKEYKSRSPWYAEMKKKDMAALDAFEAFQNGLISADEVIRKAAPYHIAYRLLQQQIARYIISKQWDRAIAVVESYAPYFEGSEEYNTLLHTLQEPYDETITIKPFPNTVNTVGDEYAPTVSADDNTLYFCGKNRRDNYSGEDIYISRKINGEWERAQVLNALSSSENDAPLAISTDATTMLMFRNGKLCQAHKRKEGWSKPEPLQGQINISSWQADAMITADGKAMLFVANRMTVTEIKPSVNIFVSELDSTGNWGKPIDLGPVINTQYAERAPILHPDMKTLYFCSEGHGSIGGMDVFKTTRLKENSWTEWSTPVNLGKEINTVEMDCWYKISTDGKKAYFSREVYGDHNLYWVNMPDSMQPEPVMMLSGQVTQRNGNAADVIIRWEDLDTHTTIGQCKTDPANGHYYIVLPLGKHYGYYIDDQRYFPVAQHVDLRDSTQTGEIHNDIQVVSIEQMLLEGIPFRLNNLFFATAKWDVLPESMPELERVAQILKGIDHVIEISGHTDDVGNNADNQLLSERRAGEVKRILIERGCNKDKLVAKGYGEDKPIVPNDSPENRQLNRRVELRIVK